MVASERQGGDITIADMIANDLESSEIQRYFAQSTVFLTGATGFLGKLILEKLLRSCPDVQKIYILIRTKKEKSIEKRFQEMLDTVPFDRIKREQPKFQEKIALVSGDCILPNLGISDDIRQKLSNEVNCIFHCAATVRFDEKIRTASFINVRATRDILDMARDMKYLKSVIYISTAFSNCVRKDIDENFYEAPITGEKLLKLVDLLSEESLEKITPIIIGRWPNTYTFTKAVAEEVVRSSGKGLPVAIVRPSIVIATVNEPVAGFIDNFYGATGVLLGVALGLIRTLHCDADCTADMVPADYVINCSIAAAWDVGTTKGFAVNNEISSKDYSEEVKNESDIPIFNYVCSTQKPITWRQYNKLAEKYLKQIPSPLLVWHYCFIVTSSYYMYIIYSFLLHTVPAHIVDFFAKCIGKEPLLVKGYHKIHKFLKVLSYFATQQWRFTNSNTKALTKKMNPEDQRLFEFDMEKFEWDPYFYTYARGGRVYLCKDPLDTLPQGRVKYIKLQVAHYVLCTILLLLFFKLLMVLCNAIF